ncbi:L-rhamnose/proton symporter RhaT [Flammeovirgaceae bacterium SG7u.111]|nr:L-rhamnose/proton symporter RhaT [Flammeovirgaceae bacterium SG7u.132]WPO33656.1 L-rhamnose/proton symporter RhaT [Flammeovirgaceae bacterium SG7u.111]
MIEGIIWALMAGVMLGLYALPEKFTKGFEFEHTWGTMFFTALFVVPVIACFSLIQGFGAVLGAIPTDVLIKMAIASLLWGVGVMMWGKAINHIGLSLGFSLFIGTIILVGSLIPFFVVGLPASNVLTTILGGIFIVLIGVFANGKAGLLRQAEEDNAAKEADSTSEKGSMTTGILIAVIGGLLATGFSYANAVGAPIITEAVVAQGNPEWMSALAVMFIIYVAGGLFVVPYFVVQLSQKGLWGKFSSAPLGKNLTMTTIMAVLNFAASAAFAFAAFKLGKAGGTVGYAIFNTISVAVAIVSGLVTGEWVKASGKAKGFLYIGLASMIIGVVVVAVGNGL